MYDPSVLSFHCVVAPRFCLFFFLMIRRPPRSTLFPTRRSSDLASSFRHVRNWVEDTGSTASSTEQRSEEHTSELQSPDHLVCRLLLEKKNDIMRYDQGWATRTLVRARLAHKRQLLSPDTYGKRM